MCEMFNPTGTMRAPPLLNLKDKRAMPSFLVARNACHPPQDLAPYFAEDGLFVDTVYYNPIVGRVTLLWHFHLYAGLSALLMFAPDKTIDVYKSQ